MTSPWIDIAIAVAFVFFVFSMVVSGLNELINWIGQVRSKQLWQALHDLTRADVGYGVDHPRAERQLASRVVKFLQGLRDTFFRIPTGRVDHRPLVRPKGDLHGSEEFLSVLRSTASFRSLETAAGGRTAIRHVPATTFVGALQELVLRGDGELRRILNELHVLSPMRRKLDDTEALVVTNAAAFRDEVSLWFDSQMAQLSHRYRKDVRRVMFALGLLVAVVANVNAIHVVASAQRDSDLRQALVVSATEAAASPTATTCPATTANPDSGTARLECLRDDIARARALKVTTFWDLDGPCRNGKPCSSWARRALDVVPAAWHTAIHRPLASLGRLLGWLMSAVALSFGGAFWFDLLRRAVGYRRVAPGKGN